MSEDRRNPVSLQWGDGEIFFFIHNYIKTQSCLYQDCVAILEKIAQTDIVEYELAAFSDLEKRQRI